MIKKINKIKRVYNRAEPKLPWLLHLTSHLTIESNSS